jgi:hypothetical protein
MNAILVPIIVLLTISIHNEHYPDTANERKWKDDVRIRTHGNSMLNIIQLNKDSFEDYIKRMKNSSTFVPRLHNHQCNKR